MPAVIVTTSVPVDYSSFDLVRCGGCVPTKFILMLLDLCLYLTVMAGNSYKWDHS